MAGAGAALFRRWAGHHVRVQILDPARQALDYVSAHSAGGPMDEALTVTINFQPDRRTGGEWILDRLAREGRYQSQFETGHSSGSVPIDPECVERWQFEHDNFGGAYDDAPPIDRPKYGAVDFLHDGFGAAPRYGSAHLRPNRSVLDRATFCYPDSAAPGKQFGTARTFALIDRARADLAAGVDPLKVYVEAHIHGPLLLDDCEAVVLDPSFRNTDIQVQADRLGIPLEWHAGFVVDCDTIRAHPGFRGPEIVELACSLAHDGNLTPACLTPAAERGEDPRLLRRVWHYLARFGGPNGIASPKLAGPANEPC